MQISHQLAQVNMLDDLLHPAQPRNNETGKADLGKE
jgi:hypothetical protein